MSASSWGPLGKPPPEILNAGWGFGKMWSELSERAAQAERMTGLQRSVAMRKIDWERERLIASAQDLIHRTGMKNA